MIYLIKNKCIITWKLSEAIIINLEAMNSIKCHSAALIINDVFAKMVLQTMRTDIIAYKTKIKKKP